MCRSWGRDGAAEAEVRGMVSVASRIRERGFTLDLRSESLEYVGTQDESRLCTSLRIVAS